MLIETVVRRLLETRRPRVAYKVLMATRILFSDAERQLLARLDAELTPSLLQALRIDFDKLSKERRRTIERLLRDLLKHPRSPMAVVLNASRELDKPKFRGRLRLQAPLVFWLLPTVRDLAPELCDAARRELKVRSDDALGARFDVVVSSLRTTGSNETRIAMAVACELFGGDGTREPFVPEASQEPERTPPVDATDDHEVRSLPTGDRSSPEALSWERVLVWAENLAADDELWSGCDEFVERVRELALRKAEIRARAVEETVHRLMALERVAAIRETLQSFRAELSYLKLELDDTDVTTWEADHLATFVDELALLAHALSELRTARGLPADTAEDEDERARRISVARKSVASALPPMSARTKAQPHTLDTISAPSSLVLPPEHVESVADATHSGPIAPPESPDPREGCATPDDENPTTMLAATPLGSDSGAPVEAHDVNRVPPRAVQVVSEAREAAVTTVLETLVSEPPPSLRSATSRADTVETTITVEQDTGSPMSLRAATSRADAAETTITTEHDTGSPIRSEPLELLARGDVAGAYWYQRCAEALDGDTTTLPSWLLEVLQASFWLAHAPALGPMLTSIVDERTVGSSDESQTIALAAALLPVVAYPDTHLRAWLQVQGPAAAPLQRIVDAITTFSNLGQGMSPALAAALDSMSEQQGALDLARKNVRAWLHDTPRRTTKYQRATRIWVEFLQKELAMLLNQLLENRSEVFAATRRALEQWKDRSFVTRRIERYDSEIRSPGAKRVEFGAREQLILLIRDSVEIAFDLLVLSERGDSGDWLLARARELQSIARDEAPHALRELHELSTSGSHKFRALALVVEESLIRLLHALRVPVDATTAPPSWPGRRQLEILVSDVASLADALKKRLLWHPSAMPLDSAALTQDEAVRLMAAIAESSPSLDASMQIWIDSGRFDIAREVLAAVGENVTLTSSLEHEQARARLGLSRALDEAITHVERGVVDGYATTERAELLALLSSISPNDTLNFAIARESIRKAVARLALLRQDHLHYTRVRWEELKQRLDATVLDERGRFIEAAILSEDVRAADEAIYQLEDRLNAHSELSVTARPKPGHERIARLRDFAREYETKVKGVPGGLHGLLKRFDTLQFDSITLPTGQKREAIRKGLVAWHRLKQRDGFEQPLAELLAYFGFNVAPDAKAVLLDRSGSSWSACRVRMNDGGLCPVPQFGSATRGEYHVLCAWERPGADALTGIFHQLSRDPTVLLYLGRLTDAQRLNLRAGTRQQDLSVVCVDENLVAFLAGERDLRLRAMFECAIPYAILNPYTPYQAGDVPAEMYFGRREIAGRTKDPSGSCIVYGGRQLGKSALLRKVQRDFHNPERNQFATVIDIKLLGDPKGVDHRTFWSRVRDELQRLGFSPKRSASDDPDRIFESIRNQCVDKDSRLLLLLDEADNFLDADSRYGFG